ERSVDIVHFASVCGEAFVPDVTPSSETHTLSLHDALPILDQFSPQDIQQARRALTEIEREREDYYDAIPTVMVMKEGSPRGAPGDRKSTRLNSSHVSISYAVFCLKKKKQQHYYHYERHRVQ